jgi:hypothetical protein
VRAITAMLGRSLSPRRICSHGAEPAHGPDWIVCPASVVPTCPTEPAWFVNAQSTVWGAPSDYECWQMMITTLVPLGRARPDQSRGTWRRRS